jgi:hypothetical protein
MRNPASVEAGLTESFKTVRVSGLEEFAGKDQNMLLLCRKFLCLRLIGNRWKNNGYFPYEKFRRLAFYLGIVRF